MAKKFVRGITDIKTIEHQDFDTNNVNDLLSDGQNNYIHRKKGNSEEYHNLTNNLKTIQSDNTDLLTVTNYNNTTNSATIRPKHDAQKEQLLESTDETILIEHGENGTDETTTLDVNFEKVQEKFTTGKGLSLKDNILNLEFSSDFEHDANNLVKGNYLGSNIANAPSAEWYWISNNVCERTGGTYVIQIATKLSFNSSNVIKTYVRTYNINTWTNWRELLIDKDEITNLLAQKQNTLTSNSSIGVSGTGLRQLYTQSQTYTHTNGILKTHVKSVSNSSSVDSLEEEFNFLAKMNEGQYDAVFTLNEHDTAVFQYLVDTYGINNVINVCNTSVALNGSQLTFGSNGTTYNPHIITFSDIIPASAINTQQNAPSRGDSVTVDKVDETVEFDKTDEIVDKVDEIVDSKQSE